MDSNQERAIKVKKLGKSHLNNVQAFYGLVRVTTFWITPLFIPSPTRHVKSY